VRPRVPALPGELTTDQGKALMRSVQELGSMLVLTGGDPLKRPDIAELIEYGRSLPIHVSITPSTTPLERRKNKRNADQLGMEVIGMLWEVGVGRFC
jgi:MoaA/NifB/PqqE/SkfB family radical SAM enzyme